MRRYLTEKEREAMYEHQGGKCARCGNAFEDGRCIAEHWTPVALGNTSKPDCLLCIPCADRKTNGSPATSYGSDKHGIAKVKRILRKAAGTWRPNRKKLASRGFSTRFKKKLDGSVEDRSA